MLATLCLLLVGLDQKDSYTVRLWPRLASTTTAARSWLVMLELIHLRCVPSACRHAGSGRALRRHRQVHARAGFAGCDASAVAGVAGIALCFLRCRQAHDARHHGRYDHKDFLQRHSGRPSVDMDIGMCMAGVAGVSASCAVFPVFVGRVPTEAMEVAPFVVDIGSCMFMAGFADDAIRAVLPSISDRPMVDVWCPPWTRQLSCPFPKLHFIDEVGFTCLSLCNDRCFSPGSASLLAWISLQSRWADGLFFGRGSCPQGHGSHN